MELSLQSIESLELEDAERNIFNAIKGSLHSSLSTEEKAQNIASDIKRLCEEKESSKEVGMVEWGFWTIVLEFAYILPPDHPWQDCLVKSIETLRQGGGEIKRAGFTIRWAELYNLSICLYDNWSDPTWNINLEDEQSEGEEFPEDYGPLPTEENLTKWKNLNSFAARLTSQEFAPWFSFRISAMRTAFESEAATGDIMNCRLWVASEWLLRCGDIIFEDMCSQETHKESFGVPSGPGSLCPSDIPALSLKRWEFWKKRLLEIGADRKNMELGDASCGRILDTLQIMSIIEEQHRSSG